MHKLPFAEDSNYWQTSKSSPGHWIDKAAYQVEKIGGHVSMRGMGSHPSSGRSAYILIFEIDNDSFRIVWPVLPLKSTTLLKAKAAQRQAATLLFHDVKARCLSSAILGARIAFFSFILLSDGKVASESSKDEIAELGSSLFGSEPPLLEGEIIDTSYENT